jgi:hypothetical protein
MTFNEYVQHTAALIYASMLKHEKFLENASLFDQAISRAIALAKDLRQHGFPFKEDGEPYE